MLIFSRFSISASSVSRLHGLPAMMIVLLLFAYPDELAAQRGGVSYPQLRAQNVAPGLYLDHHVIPTAGGEDNVWMNFRFGYDVLQFRRLNADNRGSNPPDSASFVASAELQVQIYQVDDSFDEEQLDARQPVQTLNWSGRAYASEFEQTQQATRFLDGYASFRAEESGHYAYRVRVSTDGTNRPLRRNLRRFIVPDFSKLSTASAQEDSAAGNSFPIYLLQAGSETDAQPGRYQLSNYGRSVMYAEDFEVLMHLPEEGEAEEFRLLVERRGPENTQVFEHELSDEDLMQASAMHISADAGTQLHLNLSPAEAAGNAGFRLAHVKIPNAQFRNSRFVLKLMRGDETVSSRPFQNLWIDIPSSLLNIDVALSMMRLIVDEDTYDRLRSGKEAERIRKFYDFWDARDPEPEQQFNPLMVEFYTRVDEAFDRFSSLQVPGYETDQGKTYIRFGSPQDIERRLPSDSPAREIWTYENREFVFEATSGFGEYQLVERRRR